jgi:hypothetical protein
MMRFLRFVAVVVLVGGLGGCEPAPVAIPAGAQQIAVTVTATTVTLTPAKVPAGDVYLVLSFPAQGPGEVLLLENGNAGLTDAQLANVAQTGGDFQGGSTKGLSASCCGNVDKETFTAGKYAIILPGPQGSAAVTPPLATAILQVGP